MQFPILIGLRRSVLLGRAIAGVGLCAVLVIAVTPWPLPLRSALLVLGGLLTLEAWRRSQTCPAHALLLGRNGTLAVRWSADASFSDAAVIGRPFVHPWLVCCVISDTDGRRWPLAIVRDGCDEAAHRRLRIWLRYRTQTENADFTVDVP